MSKAKILLSMVFIGMIVQSAFSQNYNPPYPRIGQIYFYHPGQAAEIWKNHDLVVIRYKYDDEARKIKEKNPDVILLATNDIIAAKKSHWPDDWYIKCSDCKDGKLDSYHEDFGLLNITPDCPSINHTYGSQKFNEFLPRYLQEHIDWNYFDGTLYDYWANAVWHLADKADINNDGSADGKDYVNSQWEKGNAELIANTRALNDGPVVAHESGKSYLNGYGFEFWPKLDSKSALSELFKNRDRSVDPVINFAEGYGYEKGPDFGSKWRVDFASSQIGGAYFGHDEGTTAHRFTFLHDEYEANLGQPLSGSAGEPIEIQPDVWARYFEFGAIISNVSGGGKTVSSGELDGRTYWRFLGAQNKSFNNGTQFSSVNFDAFDGIMLFTKSTTLVTPIIIDNIAVNMTTLGQSPASYSGTWTKVRWPEKAEQSNTGYGLGIFWDNEENIYSVTDVSGEATYRATINVSGSYEVSEWHPNTSADGFGTACSDVELVITSSDGTVTKTVNQSVNYGRWNVLGVYKFNAGSTGKVVLKAKGGCITASDAIRFKLIDPNADPTDFPPNAPTGFKAEQN